MRRPPHERACHGGRQRPSIWRASPRRGRLARAARLYGVVLDSEGRPGGRRFLAELPEGAAVFALAAPGVRFLLHDHAASDASPCSDRRSLDAAAIDAWYRGLLTSSRIGAQRRPRRTDGRRASGGPAPPARASRRAPSSGSTPTTPVLRYPAVAGVPAIARHVAPGDGRPDRRPVTDAAEVRAFTTATLLDQDGPQMLGKLSADLAAAPCRPR